MQETWVQSLGGEDPLEEEMKVHSSILAWETHGQRSLAGYGLEDHEESDMTELSPLILKLHQQSAEIEKCPDQQLQEPQP